LTPEQRRLRAELGAHALWGRQTDRAFLAKLEAEVDPDGTLPPKLRASMVEHRRQEHMKRMALAAAEKRRKKGGDEAVA
jgi:hypothetical protein